MLLLSGSRAVIRWRVDPGSWEQRRRCRRQLRRGAWSGVTVGARHTLPSGAEDVNGTVRAEEPSEG